MRTLCKNEKKNTKKEHQKNRYSYLGFHYRRRQPMKSVAARSSRPLRQVVASDWLHEVMKLGDPDLASAVFPAYAESKLAFLCVSEVGERYRMCVE